MESTKNKYGFEENFNGSSISDQSLDIIIVEPLDEEQQAINKSNALYLTGMHPVNKSPQQSVYQNTSSYKPQSQIPLQQQSQRPVYNPNQVSQRNNPPIQSTIRQQQPPPPPQQSTQKSVEIAPRLTQTVMRPPPEKPVHQAQIMQQQPAKSFPQQFVDSDEEESIKVQERASNKMPSVSVLPKTPPQPAPQPVQPPPPRMTVSKAEKAPVLSLQEKQQQMNAAKQQLMTSDQLPIKISTQQYNGGEMLEMVTLKNGVIKINPDLNALLSHERNSIVFVGILGQTKSGKSTLLNEIAHLNAKQKFGNSGVWIYIKPLIVEQKSYYFIDCTTDNQLLCAFVMLACSTLLYNTIKLDDNSIWCFPVLDTLMRVFGNENALTQLLPNFVWVQRDKLKASPINDLQDYLVKANKGQLLENLIRSREVAQITPEGTSEYQISMQQLRDRLVFGGICKQINGYNLNGPLMYLYLEYMQDMLNQPKVLRIEDVWVYITEEYTKFMFNYSLNQYVTQIGDWIKDAQQIEEKDLYFKFRDLKDLAVQEIYPLCYLNNKNRSYQIYKKKLLEVLTNKERQALQYCTLASQVDNEAIIKKTVEKMSLKDVENFTQQFNQLFDQLSQQRYQFNQCSVFVESMGQNYKKLIEDLFAKYQKAQSGEEQQFLLQKSRQSIQNREEELQKKKDQVSLQEKRKNLLIKEIQDLQDQIKLERESVAQPKQSIDPGLDEQIYKLKQEKASNIKEINLLKKQFTELQRRKQEEGNCLIF